MFGNKLINTNAGGGCTNTVDLYNPFPDGGGVALYQLNGDATDVSGNYDGTATDVTYGAGEFGQAGVFNGSSSLITLPSSINTSYINPSGQFSFSLWVKLNEVGTNQYRIIDFDVPNNIELTLNANGQQAGKIIWVIYNTSYEYLVSNTTVVANTWYHISVTYNNGFSELFINGSSEGTMSKTLVQSSQNIGLGARFNNTENTNGSIDQVRFFNRALRPYEVEALYTEEYCTPTIVPSEHFNTVLYEGNGGTLPITDVGFQPDFVWLKCRNVAKDHRLYDSVRGVANFLESNNTDAEAVAATSLTSFDTNGFTLGAATTTNSNGDDFVAWNFKAGGAAVTNTDGTITSQVSANTEAGFSVVGYTSSGSVATVGHGLGVAPNIIIAKNRGNSGAWNVYISEIGNDKRLRLDDTSAATSNTVWGNTNPTDSVFTQDVTAATTNIIAYCFAEVEGFSNFGSYVGTGASGNTVVTGFEPAFVMIKGTSLASQWNILDNKRDTTNPATHRLFANLSNAESTGINALSFLENGFEINNSDAGFNGSGQSYIYMAFAADPTTIEPSLEDSFNIVLYTGDGTSNRTISGYGFDPDFLWMKPRNFAYSHNLYDTVRGDGIRLVTNSTAADQDIQYLKFTNDGFIEDASRNNESGVDYVVWGWKGAEIPAINSNGSIPSVVSANPAAGFSIVSYNSNGTAGSTIGHGLEAEPKMIIVKNRDDVDKWAVYHNSIGATDFLVLNETAAAVSSSAYWNNTSPNSNVFTVGSTSPVNSPNNENYIAYCFAEVAGFSKFGSYTGTGSARTISLDFTPAFVMIKRTGTTGSWQIFDNKRSTYRLIPNSTSAEQQSAGTNDEVTLVANGFTLPTDAGNGNNSALAGNTYIYMAFANQF